MIVEREEVPVEVIKDILFQCEFYKLVLGCYLWVFDGLLGDVFDLRNYLSLDSYVFLLILPDSPHLALDSIGWMLVKIAAGIQRLFNNIRPIFISLC